MAGRAVVGRAVVVGGFRGAPRAEPGDRWERAHGLLRGFEARADGAESGARELPVAEPLARLLPAGGLRRGSTVAVSDGPGSSSLLLALLAAASAGGAWLGVIGRPELGVVAAAEAGIQLGRLALVPRPGADLLAVTSALLDGLDVVAVAGADRAGLRAADRQRLAGRARQRAAVLVSLGPWPGADLELSCDDARWLGLGEGSSGGGGRLRSRRIRVHLRGRGVRPGRAGAQLLLPAPGGGIAESGRDADRDRAAENQAATMATIGRAG